MQLWDDPRVVRGMQAQLEMRRLRLADGDKSLGWKVGFGAPAMLKQLQISGPLVGFLTQNARVQSGASVSLAGWAKPVAEPEIAVHIGRDVAGGGDREAAAAAIAGISPAIELVDVHTPPIGSTSNAIPSSPGSSVSGATTEPVMMISPACSVSPNAASTSATWRTMSIHCPVLACGSVVRANSLPWRMMRQVRPSDCAPARAGPAPPSTTWR